MKPTQRMKPSRAAIAIVAATAALSLSVAALPEARANHLVACGGVLLDATASCVVLATDACTAECAPVAVENVCAYRLTSTCESTCVSDADPVCRTDCDTTCVPECTANATEPPNCMGLCMSDCQQDCTSTCALDPGEEHCRASCAHVCSNDCHEKCDAEPATTCDPVCTTACWGSCEGQANMDCQVTCQDERFVSCESDVVAECRADCDAAGGGIFCDGQFLATSDLQACADALLSELAISVDLSVTAQADADVQGHGVFSCATVPGRVPASPWPAAVLLLAGAGVLRVLRRGRR
jgi:hypothetical protein